MTKEVAIDVLKERMLSCIDKSRERTENGFAPNQSTEDFSYSLAIAIEALEKQIPKKPRIYIDLYKTEKNGCPRCERNEILYAGQKFCSVCGQAIDWSEE